MPSGRQRDSSRNSAKVCTKETTTIPRFRIRGWQALPVVLSGALAIANAKVAAQPQPDSQAPRRFAVLLGLGVGTYGRAAEQSSNPVLLLASAALEIPLTPRLILAPGVSAGSSPYSCESRCAKTPWAVDVALLWQPARVTGRWGVLFGPSMARFDHGVAGQGARIGVGAAASLGVMRGAGPRLTVRSHQLPGSTRATSIVASLSIRH